MADAVTLTTSDGESLQAELDVPDQPTAAVVVTHPHPLMGGDMYTPVPAAFFGQAVADGAATLRFNFRGVAGSTGTHDEGGAEQLDVAAAVEAVTAAAPDVPLILCGWSFGADMALTCSDERVAGWFLAAAPLRVVEPASMAARTAAAPKLFAVPAQDQFAAPDVIESRLTDGWTNASMQIIDNADHFFGPALPDLTEAFATFLAELAS